ncbi:MAG: prevent-host-death protein [Reyranellales bacterium]
MRSLTDFQRNTKEHIRRLKKSGRPAVLTVNGEAELVVQHAAAYQKLLDSVERTSAIEGIRRGIDSARAGKCIPAEQVLRDIRRELGIAK